MKVYLVYKLVSDQYGTEEVIGCSLDPQVAEDIRTESNSYCRITDMELIEAEVAPFKPQTYNGALVQVVPKEYATMLYEDYGHIEGEYGTITEVEVVADNNFEGCYWNVQLNNGRLILCISGYHLELLQRGE